MSELYVGLMSGTSQDGVDAALVEFDGSRSTVHLAATTPYSDDLKKRIADLIGEPRASLRELGELNVAVGRFFAQCVLQLIEDSTFDARKIAAIGHSGHTVFHKPEVPDAFTMQLGDPSTVAAQTGITTVGEMRNTDMALGDQGAPLAPAFHEWRFADSKETRIVVNIGGIANITVLAPGRSLQGFDTGPGNTLLDNWTRQCTGEPFDRDGEWSRTGRVSASLLEALGRDDYFERRPPKSTGLEHFNLTWLQASMDRVGEMLAEEDVQATLTELTATTIAKAITATASNPHRVILGGGGARNTAMTERLTSLLVGVEVGSSAEHGIDPEWVEAVLFAWLARARLRNEPGNAPSVTGARQAAPLGGVYFA